MIDETTREGRIIAATLRLAAEQPWHEVTLAAIAEAADTNLVDLRKSFGSKPEILAAFARAIDDEVLSRATRRQPGDSGRDAIFEVVMSRFDALGPYKPALKRIRGSAIPDPALMKALLNSQMWMLNAAGIVTDGPRGAMRIAGLATVYASVISTWLDDDDPGMARTMAVLDRRLRRGERAMASVDEACATLGRIASIFRPGAARRDETGPASGTQPAAGAASGS